MLPEVIVMELLVGALLEIMDEPDAVREPKGRDLDEVLAARCTAL